jgi:hypothetical protein
MKIRKLLMMATILVAPIYVAPVAAQTPEQWEQMDAAYEACKVRFIQDGFGDDNLASQWCYPRIYGGETSGGGGPGTYPVPPGNHCYGQQAPCNPNFN